MLYCGFTIDVIQGRGSGEGGGPWHVQGAENDGGVRAGNDNELGVRLKYQARTSSPIPRQQR